ncbi:MAG: transcription antitermination factor NusB [Gammaproteobacteria bacterium]
MEEVPNKPFSPRARVRARRTAVQAYYQWLMARPAMSSVIDEFENDRAELKKADKSYFRDLLEGMEKYSDELDRRLGPLLDRPLEEINPVECAILKLGLYELSHHPELPWRVVLNESIELAKMFGAEQSHKYINGVLDRAARQIRPEEISNTP